MNGARLEEMLNRHVDGSLSRDDRLEFERMLLDSAEARDAFWRFTRLHSLIREDIQTQSGRRVAADAAPIAVTLLDDIQSSGALPGRFGWFTQTGPLSYMVATLVLCLMLLGAWAYKINHDRNCIATNSRGSTPFDSSDQSGLVFVGKITGMKDCRWSETGESTLLGASVPLDREYSLASGLLEITYHSGAKVILEGPCTYKVDSDTGGFLERGKLTARIDSAKPQAANLESRIPNPEPRNSSLIPHPSSFIPNSSPLSTLHSPLFAVRTPTAIVTDLGTEFGVEVAENGDTVSYVFQGTIKVQGPAASAAGGAAPKETTLRENESIRVSRVREMHQDQAATELVRFTHPTKPPKFVRSVPSPRDQRNVEAERYAELVLSFHPVAYYRMERPKDKKDDNVVLDSSGGGCHGVLHLGNSYGSPYRRGRWGDALWFRGPRIGDFVVVNDYPKAKNNRLSAAAWVMAEPWTDWWPRIVGNGVNEPENRGQFTMNLFEDSGKLGTRILSRTGDWVTLHEDAVMPQLQWQHIAFVVDGNVLRLYRNGREMASMACAGVEPEPPVPTLSIGTKLYPDGSNKSNNSWRGLIDELAIFNTALTADDIRRLYSAVSDGAAIPDSSGIEQEAHPEVRGGKP